MNIKFTLFIYFIISYLFPSQNEILFKPINSYLQRYRHSIEEKAFYIKNGTIYMELEGRRTNQNSLFLLGFYSIGRQLQKNKFNFINVQIIIHYEMKEPQEVAATATIESVLALSQGEINQEQFFNNLEY